MTDQERHVRTELLSVDGLEILLERPPPRDQCVRAERELDDLAAARRDRCERVAAVPRQLRRVALMEVAGERAIDEERAVRMPVRIDEPRGHDPLADLEHGRDLGVVDRRQVADGEDPVAEDRRHRRAVRADRCRRPRSRRGARGRSRSCCDGDTFARPLARNRLAAHLLLEDGRMTAWERVG